MDSAEHVRAGYPSGCECEALGANGTIIGIRPIRPDDAPGLMAFHDHLSSESIHRRFFGAHPHLGPGEVERFTCVDYQDRLALVAEAGGCLVAVARYDRIPGTDRAEVAFVVADALHGQGVGTLLLEHLAAAARRRGIGTFFAETLAYNHPMVGLFRQSGFSCTSRMSQGVIDLSFSISPTQGYLHALTERNLHARRARLGPAALSAESVGRLSVNDLLAYLATEATTPAIALELGKVAQPRRFVALARAVAQRKPVLARLTNHPDQSPDLREVCTQAGIELLDSAASLAGRLREVVAALEDGAWEPARRGALGDPDGCDINRGRMALARRATSPVGDLRPLGGALRQLLDPTATEELLAAYGLVAAVARTGDVPRGLQVTVNDDCHGLAARIDPPSLPPGRARGSKRPPSRVLPLTDRDAWELVCAAAPQCGELATLADRVMRATRLVDDQSDVSCLNLPLLAGGDDPAPSVWVGPPRSSDDDPFVSRLICCKSP